MHIAWWMVPVAWVLACLLFSWGWSRFMGPLREAERRHREELGLDPED